MDRRLLLLFQIRKPLLFLFSVLHIFCFSALHGETADNEVGNGKEKRCYRSEHYIRNNNHEISSFS